MSERLRSWSRICGKEGMKGRKGIEERGLWGDGNVERWECGKMEMWKGNRKKGIKERGMWKDGNVEKREMR